MGDVQNSQSYLQSVTTSAGDVETSQAYVLGVYSFPTPLMDVGQSFVQSIQFSANEIEVSQGYVQAVVRGRIENPRLKAWKFKLDSHEFYVLRLGEDKTLVFDMLTRQWSWWGSPERTTWRANIGLNWKAPGDAAFSYGSNVVCGDDTLGLLWILNPEQGYDDFPEVGNDTIVPFFRRATAQVISRGRAFIPVYDMYLTATPGQPAFDPATVSLKYSDDGGQNFVNAGNVTINPFEFNQEYAWRSLGRIQAPGRLFQIEDDGAFARIDGLDMNTTVGE